MIHSTFYTGSKIRIIMRDGSQYIVKFKERKNNLIRTFQGDFKIPQIRSANYYKPHPHERK